MTPSKQDLSGSLHYLKEKDMDKLYRKVKCPDCCWSEFESGDTYGMAYCCWCSCAGYIFKPVEEPKGDEHMAVGYKEMAEENLEIVERFAGIQAEVALDEPKGDDGGLLTSNQVREQEWPHMKWPLHMKVFVDRILAAQRDLTRKECQQRVEGIKREIEDE